MNKTRGRPKQYDEEQALASAGQVFWAKGLSATSLDDLSEAMGMNRPSIYRAFGDKESIYRRSLQQFIDGMEDAFFQTMIAEQDIARGLTKFYRAALAIYTNGDQPKGCMVMSTAVAAAIDHPEVQTDLLAVVRSLDRQFEERFEKARIAGEISDQFSSDMRAALAQSLLHSLSLRARAGDSSARLKKMIKSGVAMILV